MNAERGPTPTAVTGPESSRTAWRQDPEEFDYAVVGSGAGGGPLAAYFQGYYPGYAEELFRNRRHFTWAVLKAHTANSGGRVTLGSSDPRHRPAVSFRYFEEGTDTRGEDLDAVVRGIHLARDIMRRAGPPVKREVLPGDELDTVEQLRTFVRDQAWGHHACGTARIGRENDPFAVVDSRFRVWGTRGLRVVDASVFPRIPGFFIVTAVYMIPEKASAAILEDAPTGRRRLRLPGTARP